MRYPESLVGRVVFVQLARPLYVIRHAGYIKGLQGMGGHAGAGPVEVPTAEPLVKDGGPLAFDFLPNVVVHAVHEGTTTFLVQFEGALIEKTVHNDCIVSIDRVQLTEVPAAMQRIKQQSSIITP